MGMFALFDPLYMMIMLPALILSIWAQAKVKGTFDKYSRVAVGSRLTGAEAARRVLDSNSLSAVRIEKSSGMLSDHYDPGKKVLRLSHDVYAGQSVSAVGVATHEAGHALQHAKGYAPLHLRTLLVPTASFGSYLAFPLIVFGMFINVAGLVNLGIIAFTLVVLFQLVTLPVEFDASSRAKKSLQQFGVISSQKEAAGVRAVLNAAALTYVAAAVVAITQLLYFLLRSGILGGGDD